MVQATWLHHGRVWQIFHGGIDDTVAWTIGGKPRTLAGAAESDMAANLPAPSVPDNREPVSSDQTETAKHNAELSSSKGMKPAQYSDRVIVLEGDGEGHGDYSNADRAITALHKFKESGEPFFIGCCVTNAQFSDFIDAASYRTEAERFGWSFVFGLFLKQEPAAVHAAPRVAGSEWWVAVEGANWRHPEGPGSNVKRRWNHPVVHVSWNDALAYGAWAGKRLPTEAE